ncbi:hypothetical protein OG777_09810 [Micromonospora peucetia]|uniref:Uncharacterized protein n=1 Tax=Micromonospora peucetia TaxID=47871 RepID=A0ABZ1EK90_9ACTN|nr:hypothetical protein [Micromonospora peucetia]MCX4387225.1 hypothetical protein [Micromonospora peucetia]WSA34653.1 hypothetical protein OIE14_11695 [Micromonospora peucetia]
MPAPALPGWPPPTNPVDRRPGGAGPTTAPLETHRLTDRPDGAGSVGGPSARVGRAGGTPAGRYDGGPDLGTLYGAGTEGPGFSTVSLPDNPVENSGSLTGHILAQGWTETPTEERSSTTKVVVVLAASLGLLVAIGVLVVLLANDTVGGLVGGVLSK